MVGSAGEPDAQELACAEFFVSPRPLQGLWAFNSS